MEVPYQRFHTGKVIGTKILQVDFWTSGSDERDPPSPDFFGYTLKYYLILSVKYNYIKYIDLIY